MKKRVLSGVLIALALCCALAGRTATVSAAPATATATLDDPPPTCQQIYEAGNAQAWANFDYCKAHSGGNFYYLQGCYTQLEAHLAANWVWYTLNC